jgi:hypothetical protein
MTDRPIAFSAKPRLSRRAFLAGISATAVAVAMPLPSMAIAAESAPTVVPNLLAFAAGSEGEFNWQPFFAATEAEAKEMVRHHFGWDGEDDPDYFPFEFQRVPKWDHRGGEEAVTPADWFRAGMGHICDRCDAEIYSGDGESTIMGEVVVCNECLTFAEKLALDDDWALDELIERIGDDGEEAARAWLDQQGAWAAAEPHWRSCCDQASAASTSIEEV